MYRFIFLGVIDKMFNLKQVEKLAKMEKVLGLPTEERLTEHYGDYDIYEPKLDVTMQQINKRIRELSPQLLQGKQCTVEIREILSRKIIVENPRSTEEAIEAVMESYNAGSIVLDADDFQSVEFNETDFEPEP